MNSLQAEIDRMKRKSDNTDGNKPKFQRRSEINKASVEEPKSMLNQSSSDSKPNTQPTFFTQQLPKHILIPQARTEKESTDVSSTGSSSKDVDNTPKSTSSSTKPTNVVLDEAGLLQLKHQLRQLGEPITLFGESVSDKVQRLKIAQLQKSEQGDRVQNIRQDVLRQQQQELLNEEDVNAESAQRSDKIAELRAIKYQQDLNRSAFDSAEKYVLFVLKRWMYLWEQKLAARDKSVNSVLLQHDTTIMMETRQCLLPLFSRLKQRTVDPEILTYLTQICELCWQKEYLKAHEVYLTMSIGNSPWPMGVTSVSIHARAAREKIGQVAHILNDEPTRKYIQAVKRLLSFVQEYAPTDPSKMFKLM